MAAVTNITTPASKATFGEAGEEVKYGEAGRGEPISGQVGNVAAGEPYDEGQFETKRHDTMPTYGAAYSNASNGARAEQAGASPIRKKPLYNPILPIGRAENGSTDYTSGTTTISPDSRDLGEQKSPLVQGVDESERASGSGTGKQNDITYDENTRRPSDSSPASGGKWRLRHRSIERPGQIYYGSMLGEAYLKQHERRALEPLHKNAQARRRAAQGYGGNQDDDLEPTYTNMSIIKQKRRSLTERIKAIF